MKIKVYIVTYNNDEVLNKNLDSLYQSDLLAYDYEIIIINNHSRFEAVIDRPNLRVVHNSVRPDFSDGHLARDWNFALIDGFRDITNPDCDIVVACQNDTIFYPNWCSYLIELHTRQNKRYDFIQFGAGDNFMSWKPRGVKQIGLWDERFCSTAFQEGDYFLRARIYHPKRVSINDHHHKRVHNEEKNRVLNVEHSQHESNKQFKSTVINKKIAQNFYKTKWRCRCKQCRKRDAHTGAPYKSWDHPHVDVKPEVKSYIMYPYFEWPFRDALKNQNFELP